MKNHVGISSFLLINLPVLPFILIMVSALFVYFVGIPHILFLALAWMAFCGSVMLIYDYFSRKRREFFILRRVCLKDRLWGNFEKGLRETFCGYCLLLAVHCSVHKRKNPKMEVLS
jgi:hypothetical protein